MRTQNVVALSVETGLRRKNLYKMFGGQRDPTLGNTKKILESLGVQASGINNPDFRSWHKADIPDAPGDVCFWG